MIHQNNPPISSIDTTDQKILQFDCLRKQVLPSKSKIAPKFLRPFNPCLSAHNKNDPCIHSRDIVDEIMQI